MAKKNKRQWVLEQKNEFYNKKLNKPKTRVVCPLRGRPKLQFQSEFEALRFIVYNSKRFHYGKSWRAYYCPACCCWHITHVSEDRGKFADILDLQKMKAVLKTEEIKPKIPILSGEIRVNSREDVIDNLLRLPIELFELSKKDFNKKINNEFTIIGKCRNDFDEILRKVHKFHRVGVDFVKSVVNAVSIRYRLSEPIIV